MQKIEMRTIKLSAELNERLDKAIEWLNQETDESYKTTEKFIGKHYTSEHPKVILFVVGTDSRPPDFQMIGIEKSVTLNILFPSFVKVDFLTTCDLMEAITQEEKDEFSKVLSVLLEKTLIPFSPPRTNISNSDRQFLAYEK